MSVARNSSYSQYKSKFAPTYIAQVSRVQATTTPATWAKALYDLLTMPRLARFKPNTLVPDNWVPDEESIPGALHLSVDNTQRILFDEDNHFGRSEKLLLADGPQAKLARTLYEYVYEQKSLFVRDVLLPVTRYTDDEGPKYLVLHAYKWPLNNFADMVSVSTAIMAV